METVSTLHASAFAYKGAGCLLLGDSGLGKSRLLAQAIVLGAQLIADDQVSLRNVEGRLEASAPEALRGALELRGLGLIKQAEIVLSHPIDLAVSFDSSIDERLPEPQTHQFLGVVLPYLTIAPPPAADISSLLLYLQAVQERRILPTDWRAGE